LTLADGGLYPIGQHATSITQRGYLMVFNDGLNSLNNPHGTDAGISRSYSTVDAYQIDGSARTATSVWSFDDGKSIYSRVCSSAYEAQDRSVLVNYAVADGGTEVRVMGLDPSHSPVFDLAYPNASGCQTSWNAELVPLENLRFE